MSNGFLLLVIILLIVIAVAVMIAGISRHKKSGTRVMKLIGAAGLVDTQLDPVGTVLIDGELWRAQSSDAAILNRRRKIRVIAMRDHLLLVEPLSDKL